ncbi:Alpha/beta hydrolase family protein [Novipirellula aureliae]|uniref:Alpha/beta hydrolase family protein n=1 Tax=Novipirellula aureliae TaxID=2527966 RepID=A0A5C6DPY6_9BACT|nr:acetylxylan esterase [Novipirellula aureliae]TWU38890.1 Alpha/beta hydrolase family protein [Novipirellula aureliae]
MKIKQRVTTLLMFAAFCTNAHAEQMGPWNLDDLYKTPQWEKTDKAAKEGMTGILYSSIPYNGNPVQVFAYYSAPKGAVPEGGWPAVVCIHGGGGTAFDAWVKRWNDHGYAAISMDLEGHLPISKTGGDRRSRLSTDHPGPSRVGVFGDYAKPIEQQWYYHAVAQVVIANSLLRSFPEVNAEKIGVTGISWGGTLTSTTMGVDNRFKFAIPVYGCGFLPDSDGHQGESIKPGQQTDVVNTNFDGSAYFKNVSIPTLWVNGTNDNHFTMPITQQSSQTVQGPAILRFQLEMSHGHGSGWNPEEIYTFADSVVNEGTPLVQFDKPKVVGDQVSVTCTASTKIAKADLLYTTDSTSVWPDRKWRKTPATIQGTTIEAAIPENAVAVFFSATDERKRMTTSEFVMTQ